MVRRVSRDATYTSSAGLPARDFSASDATVIAGSDVEQSVDRSAIPGELELGLPLFGFISGTIDHATEASAFFSADWAPTITIGRLLRNPERNRPWTWICAWAPQYWIVKNK
ncbi:MAG: hypothetical protein E7L40_03325 [Corynebacterium kroppenstedtii]|nr:hypothetical protein [Corynebacterium kroppenstedtii]